MPSRTLHLTSLHLAASYCLRRSLLCWTTKTSRPQRSGCDTDGLHQTLAKATGWGCLVNVMERLTCRARPAVESKGNHCRPWFACLQNDRFSMRCTRHSTMGAARQIPNVQTSGRIPVAPRSGAIHPIAIGNLWFRDHVAPHGPVHWTDSPTRRDRARTSFRSESRLCFGLSMQPGEF